MTPRSIICAQAVRRKVIQMDENHIWIVGASTGIGRELALQYADLGKKVTISARSADTLETVKELRPKEISSLPLDVTNPDDVTSAVESQFQNTDGRPGLVILNAGTYRPMSYTKFSSAFAEETMAVNYMGVVRCIEGILPYYVEQGKGHLVVVSSVAGYQGLPKSLAYGPTKAALINLCEGLNIELSGTGVRVQVVNPGFVKTPLTAGNKFPMPFLMEVEDAAQRIISGTAKDRFEIAFPTRFALILKFIGLLPYSLSLPLIRKMTG